jgi:hypothetical protein
MTKDIGRRHDAHLRCRDVLVEQRAIFDATPGGQKAFAQFEGSNADTDRLSKEQSDCLEARLKALDIVKDTRVNLYGTLKHVVKISPFVQLNEGSAKVMRLPRNTVDQTLIDDARAIRDAVTPNADAFKAAGLPASVMIDLNQQIDAFAAARTAAQTQRKKFGAITKAILIALRSGDQALEALGTILAATPGVDPKAIEWLRTSRQVGPSRVKTDAQTPTAAPTPEPTAKPA